MKVHEYVATIRAFGRTVAIEFDGDDLRIEGLELEEAAAVISRIEADLSEVRTLASSRD